MVPSRDHILPTWHHFITEVKKKPGELGGGVAVVSDVVSGLHFGLDTFSGTPFKGLWALGSLRILFHPRRLLKKTLVSRWLKKTFLDGTERLMGTLTLYVVHQYTHRTVQD